MVTVDEAFQIILSHLVKRNVSQLSIEESRGRILAEPVTADRDFPPFNRVAMDGIAILHASFDAGIREFPIEGIQAAGEPAKTLSTSLNCMEVMTGAVLPANADTVIRYEDIKIAGGKAIIQVDPIVPGQHVHHQGRDGSRGELLLEPGKKISPAEVALFAAVGKADIRVYDFPATALVSSGDELIEVDRIPEPHQIRRSNVYALQAAMNEMGWRGKRFHFRDDREELTRGLKDILNEYDVVILSGGVSKGKFDFIPEVLEANGIRKKFHQVKQRPGKPFWFGVSDSGKVVFALPGNPVSTFMCFYRYIRPWMERSLGVESGFSEAVLAEDVMMNLPLTQFLQVRVGVEKGILMAHPCAGGGSGDFSNLKEVTGFLELPPSPNGFRRGSVFSYIPFR